MKQTRIAFEWNEPKRASNLARHGVDFRRMVALFEGDFAEIEDGREDCGEPRFIAFGELDGRVYVVAYTWRDGNRRIISARRANEHERRRYDTRGA